MDGRGCIEVKETEVVNLWCTVGASEDLATDADVTRFLLALYFADSSDGKKHAVRCAVCKSSLTPLCYACRIGRQKPKQSVSPAGHENVLWVKVVRDSEERVGTDTGVCRKKGGSRQSKKPVSSTITTDSPEHLSTNKLSFPPFTVQSEMDIQANMYVRSSQSSTKRYADCSASEKSSSNPSGVKKFKTLKGSAPETDHPQRSPTKFGKVPSVSLMSCDGASTASTAVQPHERRASLAYDKVSPPLFGASSSRTDLQPPEQHASKPCVVASPPCGVSSPPCGLASPHCDQASESSTDLQPQEQHLPRSLEQIYRDLESVLSVKLDSLFDESQNIQVPLHCRTKGIVATFDQYWSGKRPLVLGKFKTSHHFCQDCNSVFEDKINLKEHTQTEGACAKDPSRPVDERSKQILTRIMEKYLHCCHDCKLVFSRKRYLKGHLNTHSGLSRTKIVNVYYNK